MRHLSTFVEFVGLLALCAAAYFLDWRLGLAVAGAALVLIGAALDRPRRSVE